MITRVLCLIVCSLLLVSGQDPQRPQYHVMPPSNWMNDPNGPMYFNGIYHLFYQYNPNAAYWGDMHWGHAVSKDLVHWQNLPPALYPDKPYDTGGVFSGSATIVNGAPILIYTGIGPVPSQCIAEPLNINDPLLLNWTKPPQNPVIPQSPPGLNLDGYRDPTTAWQSGDSYYIAVGAGISGTQGMALLYETNNFLNWTYLHPLYQSTNVSVSGDMWECPDFYPLGEQYVFKASTSNGDMWFVGDYNQSQMFSQINQGLYDYGKFYASKTFNDTRNDRRILWGWVAEMDSQDSANARGWAGLQCLPRELTLTPDNKVAANPIVELASLRTNYIPFGVVSVDSSGLVLNGISTGDQFEILIRVLSVDPGVTSFGLFVRQSPDFREQTAIFLMSALPPSNTDMPGLDYRGVAIETEDPEICQTLCYSDFMCRAWTYTPPGMEGPSAMCFLKGYPPALNPRQGCVSGRKGIVGIDRTNSSLATDADKSNQAAPLDDNPATLHVFVDHSIIEIFGNDGTSNIISRVYPTLPQSMGVSLFVEGQGQVLLSVDAWELGSIWSNSI